MFKEVEHHTQQHKAAESKWIRDWSRRLSDFKAVLCPNNPLMRRGGHTYPLSVSQVLALHNVSKRASERKTVIGAAPVAPDNVHDAFSSTISPTLYGCGGAGTVSVYE